VCRLRDVPIITFVNELDREGRDPFDLSDEIELALDVTPASWPIGIGRDFLGTYRPAIGSAKPRCADDGSRGAIESYTVLFTRITFSLTLP